jgi:hypothetical protein
LTLKVGTDPEKIIPVIQYGFINKTSFSVLPGLEPLVLEDGHILQLLVQESTLEGPVRVRGFLDGDADFGLLDPILSSIVAAT